MPISDSPNPLKRSRSTRVDADGPANKKLCSNERKARCGSDENHAQLHMPILTLEKLLRRLAKSVDFATLRALKGLASGGENGECVAVMVQSVIEHVKDIVAGRCHGLTGKKKLLEGELYLEWLHEYEFILTAVENVLKSKVQLAIGRTLFSILFHLMDEYISSVDTNQDGWSHGFPLVPLQRYSWVMTLVEEANDPSTEERSTMAIQQAEAMFERFDAAMARALKRYKAECMDYRRHAAAIGRMQETLGRGCCLLSEQTGFGGADEMGFGLLAQTRDAMLKWKRDK
ncbi:hypothetical protein GGX14DRAFT_448663 [Mycena pura]|uniref:Uncharacterized protein n=1 Tax=Mycena pura TaxID=153505 RepID=A0AAD6VNY2_9AGAR|nr:hypothetical protein GGX14DRAFT_448663 [Mycena pura]